MIQHKHHHGSPGARRGPAVGAGADGEGEIMATPTPPWTPEEENKLRELIIGAKSVEAIAKLLNRTPLAVRRRASMLRLPLRKIEPRS
jgi:hypothetical protein